VSRIIGGHGKGRRLRTARGPETRPTGARVRQTLFDILAPEVPGSRFLDAFAGNGGVGLEALSRGAARVVLIDQSRAAVDAIRANVQALASAGGEVQVVRQDARLALEALADRGASFDIAYLDPPYDSGLYEPMLDLIGRRGLLAAGGVVVAEHFHKLELPDAVAGMVRTRGVRVGDHRLSFYRAGSAGGA
jgi:16S rRNA (guanine966-N2)-methyltransferase